MKQRNRLHWALAALCGPWAVRAVLAQGSVWPTQPIKLVVPYAPGGGADFTARLLAQKLGERLGQQVVVDNRGGANGLIGTESVVRAAPDGYTFLFADAAHSINPAVQSKARYDAVADFAPVSLIASSPQLLVAHPSVGASTLRELLDLPRAHTAKMSIGTSGVGSGPHLTAELLALKSGLKLTHVPYKGGGPALADVAAGHVPLVMNSVPACMPHLQGGRIKALAIAAAQRDPRLPAVPTFAESGVPDLVVLNWYAVLGPVGTPAPIVARLATELARALDLPDVKERFAGAFLDRMPQGAEALRTFLEAEVKQWKHVVASTGIRIE